MASVDPVYAQWLQSEGMWAVSTDAMLSARWGASVQTSERMTTLAEKADADAEAARQIAFMGGPLVPDEVILRGAWAGYLGQVITVTIDRLGYDAGVDVFVLRAEDDWSTGISRVNVLRRL